VKYAPALTTLLAPALLLGGAAPAQAATGTGTASSAAGVLYNDCVDHPVSYGVAVDPPDTDWFLALEVRDTTGQYVSGTYAARQFGHPTSGTLGTQMCGNGLAPGTYSLAGRLQYGLTNSAPVPTTTFTMRNPFTRTTIRPATKHPRKGSKVRIKVRSLDEMPTGYVAKDDARIVLQQKVKGRWKKVEGSAEATRDTGKAVVRFRYRGGKVMLRAVTKGSSDWDGSRSRAVKLR
jgi:hypothetical protein